MDVDNPAAEDDEFGFFASVFYTGLGDEQNRQCNLFNGHVCRCHHVRDWCFLSSVFGSLLVFVLFLLRCLDNLGSVSCAFVTCWEVYCFNSIDRIWKYISLCEHMVLHLMLSSCRRFVMHLPSPYLVPLRTEILANYDPIYWILLLHDYCRSSITIYGGLSADIQHRDI